MIVERERTFAEIISSWNSGSNCWLYSKTFHVELYCCLSPTLELLMRRRSLLSSSGDSNIMPQLGTTALEEQGTKETQETISHSKITEKRKQFHEKCSKCGNYPSFIKWTKITNCNSNFNFKLKKLARLRNRNTPTLIGWVLGADEEHTIFRLSKKVFRRKVYLLSHMPLHLFSYLKMTREVQIWKLLFEVKSAVILGLCLWKSLRM